MDKKYMEMQDGISGYLRNMCMEVRLISLVRGYGDYVHGFTGELRDLAVDDSIGRMTQWADDSSNMFGWLMDEVQNGSLPL